MIVAQQFSSALHAGTVLSFSQFNPLSADQGPDAHSGATTMRLQGNVTALSMLSSNKSCEALIPSKRPR
jgi:hypothetical protein